MKQTKPSTTFTNTRSDAEKLALATGSLSALSLLSFGAQADIIYTASPISINFNHATGIGNGVTWSVDGTNPTFKLWINSGNSDFINLKSDDGLLGRGLVQKTSQTTYGFIKLPTGFVVGPTLVAGYGLRAGGSVGDRSLLQRKNTGAIQISANAKNFTSGVNGFFGFRFTDAGLTNQFYGWAELNLDTASPGTATINRWAYESCQGQGISVGSTGGGATCGGSVPEPGTLSLTLLGLGAGGVRAWRKRKQALAA